MTDGRTRGTTVPQRVWRVAQLVLLLVLLGYIGRALTAQGDALRAVATSLEVRWGGVLFASLVVLATHAVLIQSWRLLMAGWGTTLPFGAAVRVWTTANLGRYLPGKVWSVGALAVLAQREGVSAVSATGAALLGTLLNIGAGIGVVVLAGPVVLDALGAGFRSAAGAAGVAFLIGVALLPHVVPPVLAWVARRRPSVTLPERVLSRGTLWSAALINAASWAGYGLAFLLFARAILPEVSGAAASFIAIWTASYLVGYLVLIAPGGIGAREAAMVGAFAALGLTSTAEATVLAAASRLWLIVLEVLPGLVSLALAPGARRPPP